VDALNVVRAAFEDWVTLSYYPMRKSPDQFLDDMRFEARRNRARLFTAIQPASNPGRVTLTIGALCKRVTGSARLVTPCFQLREGDAS